VWRQTHYDITYLNIDVWRQTQYDITDLNIDVWRRTHYDITDLNIDVSFEVLNTLQYHYHSLSY
jgi:hypothetical protein